MAKEVNAASYKKLVAEVKKNPGQSERVYSEASGIPMGQIGAALYKAEVDADPSLKIKNSGAAIAAARDKEGIRWPRIAARTGLSVAQVKTKYEEHTGKSASDSYTGRGRNHSGTASTSGRKTTTAGRTAGRGTSGRRAAKSGTAKSSTAGRAGRKTASAGRKTATAGRNRTRADRKTASGDPR